MGQVPLRWMVKRGSDAIIETVYIKGVPVVSRGQVSSRLGSEPLGRVFFPSGEERNLWINCIEFRGNP